MKLLQFDGIEFNILREFLLKHNGLLGLEVNNTCVPLKHPILVQI